MSSRWPDLLRLLLAALLEALWLGALAAMLVAAPPAPLVLLTWALVGGGGGRGGGAGPPPPAGGAAPAPLRYRLVLLTLGLLAVVGLVLVATPRGVAEGAGVIVRSAVYVGLSLELGVVAGRAEIDPERAFRRSVRAFVLVFVVVLVSFAAGEPLDGSGVLVSLVLLAGLASVAVARVLVTLRSIEGGSSAWRWTAGVVTAGLLALALAGLLAAVPAGGPLAWFGEQVIVVLQYLLAAVGYTIAAAGYLVMRALTTLVGLLHLHPRLPELRPPSTPHVSTVRRPPPQPRSVVPTVVGVSVLIALALVAVRLLLRSFRIERDVEGAPAVEEREHLVRSSSAVRGAGRGLAGRLARLVGRGRPRTPADALRAEYRKLERSLRQGGHAREPSWSVRRYLGSLPAERSVVERLVTLYERARYADGGGAVEWPEVQEFGRAWRGLLSTLPR
jgi:hypothetical protein